MCTHSTHEWHTRYEYSRKYTRRGTVAGRARTWRPNITPNVLLLGVTVAARHHTIMTILCVAHEHLTIIQTLDTLVLVEFRRSVVLTSLPRISREFWLKRSSALATQTQFFVSAAEVPLLIQKMPQRIAIYGNTMAVLILKEDENYATGRGRSCAVE